MKRRLIILLVAWVCLPMALLARNYDMTFNGDSPEAVFQIIKKATGYEFVYNKGILNDVAGRSVTGSYHDMDLDRILTHVINEQMGLGYEIVDKSIVLSKQPAVKSTGARITGRVVDANGEPLPGASVWLKKSPKVAAATDMDGEFSLPSGGQTNVPLVVSYIGMKRKDVNWTGKQLKITLEDDENQLDDVVVTGYQVIDKRASTSAITSIKAEDILRPDALSIDQMLEGQVPDLMYMSNSGESAAAPKIRIRGTSSIIGNREPIWVVDGIVVKDPVQISPDELNDPDYVNRIGNAISGLNPQDIERLDVLKDASATAIYGTKAANGVIVITTKRGREGAPQIRYTNNFTWKRRPRYTDNSVDVLNSKERIALSKQLFNDHYVYDSGYSLVGFEYLMNELVGGRIDKSEFDRQLAWFETENTDWFKLLTHDSFSQSHTLNLSGGGSKSSYYASLGFTDDDDIVKGTTNRRYNAMINLDVNFAKWLTAAFSLKGTVSDRSYYQNEIAPVQYAYRASRAIPAYNSDGRYYYYSRKEYQKSGYNFNILNELDNSGVDQNGNQLSFDANFRFNITDWLSANAIFSYTASNTAVNSLWGADTYHSSKIRYSNYGEPVSEENTLMPQGGELTHTTTDLRSWTARLQFDWNKYFNDETHNFSGGIGFEANSDNYKGYSNVTRGYFPDRGMSFATGIDLSKYPSYAAWIADNVPYLTNSKENVLSAYITASYNWKRLIFVNANARVDGSNSFGDRANDKLLPIWSVSGSFDAAQLDFFKQLTWLDYFSIKGSYGYQGNMLSDQSPVMIIQKEAYNEFYGEYMSTVRRNPNPDLRWEKTTSYNLGFEWGFFNRKLQLDASVYWKRTKDAFMTKTISTVNGYESYIVNGGDIDNDGYSIGITVRPIDSRDWQWSVSTNFSRAINRIKSLPAGESYELEDFLNGNAIVKGQPVGTFYSYKFLGLSPVDGGPMFDDWFDHTEDLKGLSKYDTYTSVLTATGSREPIMSGNLSTMLRWKNLRLNANFTYSLGANTRLFGMYGAGVGSEGVFAKSGEIKSENNLSRDYLDRWLKPGDEKHTNIPAIIAYSHPSYFKYLNHWSSDMDEVNTIAESYWDMYDYSDLRVVSADYLKLSTLSLSYDFPKNLLRPWGCQRLELTATGTNLFTICDSKLKGQTPTQGGFTNIQLSDRPGFSFGLNVTF
ncbi:MAG: SusC/RagA family TonB-linked outer membrane protein [Bacteroides sp.]|nr:SusC/RagA family TonB-linked outer membrane protein [Bacteroides sp.]